MTQMTPATDPRAIAARLAIGQRMTIAGLDDHYCALGCAEATAKRLERKTAKRPALVISRAGPDVREFALNDIGMAVKEVLW